MWVETNRESSGRNRDHAFYDFLFRINNLPVELLHHIVQEGEDRQPGVLFPGAKPRAATERHVRVGQERRAALVVSGRVECLRIHKMLWILARGAHRPVNLYKFQLHISNDRKRTGGSRVSFGGGRTKKRPSSLLEW